MRAAYLEKGEVIIALDGNLQGSAYTRHVKGSDNMVSPCRASPCVFPNSRAIKVWFQGSRADSGKQTSLLGHLWAIGSCCKDLNSASETLTS